MSKKLNPKTKQLNMSVHLLSVPSHLSPEKVWEGFDKFVEEQGWQWRGSVTKIAPFVKPTTDD